MKLSIFSGAIIIAGSIMFSSGSIDSSGNSWFGWIISLQHIGAVFLIIGLILGAISVKSNSSGK